MTPFASTPFAAGIATSKPERPLIKVRWPNDGWIVWNWDLVRGDRVDKVDDLAEPYRYPENKK
jgi:hypothetical protein